MIRKSIPSDVIQGWDRFFDQIMLEQS
jgi:hypothetical protein